MTAQVTSQGWKVIDTQRLPIATAYTPAVRPQKGAPAMRCVKKLTWAALALTLLASSALGAERQEYNGGHCRAHLRADEGVVVRGTASIVNQATVTKTVVCPLVRHALQPPNFSPPNPVLIIDTNRLGGTAVTNCFFEGYKDGGMVTQLHGSETDFFAFPLPGLQSTRIIIADDLGTFATKAVEYYGFWCKLPPGRAILGYTLEDPR